MLPEEEAISVASVGTVFLKRACDGVVDTPPDATSIQGFFRTLHETLSLEHSLHAAPCAADSPQVLPPSPSSPSPSRPGNSHKASSSSDGDDYDDNLLSRRCEPLRLQTAPKCTPFKFGRDAVRRHLTAIDAERLSHNRNCSPSRRRPPHNALPSHARLLSLCCGLLEAMDNAASPPLVWFEIEPVSLISFTPIVVVQNPQWNHSAVAAHQWNPPADNSQTPSFQPAASPLSLPSHSQLRGRPLVRLRRGLGSA